MTAVLKIIGGVVLLLVVLLGLAATIVPRFLDRIYYRGDRSDHFNGERFFNPDGGDDMIQPPAGTSRAGFFWRYLTKSDGRPPWPDSVAVTPSKPAARVEGKRMVVTWVGHATVLIQSDGINILTDPVWNERVGPFGIGPKRVAAPGIRFEDLPPIDLVLVSHNHYDHLDKATLKRLWDRDQPLFVTSLGNDAILRDAGIPSRARDARSGVQAIDWDGMTTLSSHTDDSERLRTGATTVRAMRVHHWGSRWGRDRNRALWSGFLIFLPSGERIFFAGDTGYAGGEWARAAARFGPLRLAILPIGAFRFYPGQMSITSHMGPVEAVRAFAGTGATTALPVHWGTFRLSFEGYDTPPRMLDLLMRCTGADPRRFAARRIGEAFDVPPAGDAPRMDLSRLDACARSEAVTALP